jgi:hypothetical protein
MSKLSHAGAGLRKEFIELLPPTIFFFFALHFVAFIRVLMLKGTGLPVTTTVEVTIAALILGKSVLIADMLPIVNRFPEKPLAYNITWKTVIYVVVAGVVHYAERLHDFARETGGLAAGNEKLLSEIVWPHCWAIQLVLFLIVLMYCAGSELTRIIGAVRMKRILFGPMPI